MAAEVRLKVQQLYEDPNPDVQKAADTALQEFQKTDLAWSVSHELIKDKHAQVQFFCAQTIYNKVQMVAKGYQPEAGIDLCSLARMLQEYLASSDLSQQSKQRLVLALSVLAVHLCTSTWTTAVSDVLSFAALQPQYAWCTILAVPENLTAVVHTYLKTNPRTKALLKSSNALISATLQYSPSAEEEPVTGSIGDSAFSLAMQSLLQWSKVMGLQLVAHEHFVNRLVELLDGPAGHSEVVLDVVVEVLQSSPGAFMIYNPEQRPAPSLERILLALVGKMQMLLPSVEQMAASKAVSLEEADASRLSRWAKMAGTLIEAYTQLLWADSGAAKILISFLGACFVVHPHIAQSVYELWAVLKDANRDSKLPADLVPKLLQELAPPSIKSFTRFGRLDSPYSEESTELLQLRDSQQDILSDMFCIAAGTAEAEMIISLLGDHLQRAESARDWLGVEIIWFAFNGIAEIFLDEKDIPDVYLHVLQSIFRAPWSELLQLSQDVFEQLCLTATALIRTCGPHYERRLQPQLLPAVQWLVSMVPRIPMASSDAVQELCGYSGQHLRPHAGELLKVVIAAVPSVSSEVDASLHGALVGIIRGLEREPAVAAFQQICEGTMATLKAGVDVTDEDGRETLHRCTCRILRCTLVMEQSGSPDASAAPGQPTPAAQTAGTCLASVLAGVWSFLMPPCMNIICAAAVPKDAPKAKPIFEYSDAALQVNVLSLLRYAAKASNEAAIGGPELGSSLVTFAAGCCLQGQFACLSAIAVLASNPERAKAQVAPALGGICTAALEHLRAGRPAQSLLPFLELASSLATSVGNELFQSTQLPMLRELCLLAVRSIDQDVLRPSLQFLLKLVMCRTVDPAALNMQEVIETSLLHFHTWPRSLNGHTFKLFSAFLERHEAVFLPLALNPAVPCVAGLPPAEQEIARKAFQTLRGPRFKAFLSDLGQVARGEANTDVLQMYGGTA